MAQSTELLQSKVIEGHRSAALARMLHTSLEQGLGYLIAVLLGGMLVLQMGAVAGRYGGVFSLGGGEELTLWMFVCLIFIGFPLACDGRLAMRLDVVSSRLGRKGRLLCAMISDAAVVQASLVFMSGGITVIGTLGGSSSMLALPEWVRFAPVAIAGGLGVLLLWLRYCAHQQGWLGGLILCFGFLGWALTQWGSFPPIAVPSLVAGGAALLLLLIGTPLPHALICGLSLALAFGSPLPEAAIVQNTVAGITKIMLLAIPFFLLAGAFMNLGGLADRLVQLASSLVGHCRSGLAQTTLLTNVMFSGISGSSIADAAFGAKVFVPALIDNGYRPERAAAIVAATSVLPNIIPPSIAFLMLASVTNLSVGALFFGGLLAGLFLALCLALALRLLSADGKEKTARASSAARLLAFRQALPALGLAVIVLVCIRFGVMTTTEAAGLAALYAFFVSLLMGQCSKGALIGALVQSARETVVVGLLIGTSAPFVFLLAVDDLPQMVQSAFSIISNPWIVLFCANVLLLLAGCLLDIGAGILLFAPLLMPVARSVGIDPVDFGVILIVNLMIGGLTPPVGILVYVTSRLSGQAANRVFYAALPLVAALLIGLAILSFFAGFRTGIPLF